MRILNRKIHKGVGFVHLMPTDLEDYWHLYNLISEGDCLKMKTTRKITKENKTGLKNV
jgi:protein pelota